MKSDEQSTPPISETPSTPSDSVSSRGASRVSPRGKGASSKASKTIGRAGARKKAAPKSPVSTESGIDRSLPKADRECKCGRIFCEECNP